MRTWHRDRSGAFFHAKATWYRDMACREVGEDQERMLATARDFDARAHHREARASASVERGKARQPDMRTGLYRLRAAR
jgi:hypothetical protein